MKADRPPGVPGPSDTDLVDKASENGLPVVGEPPGFCGGPAVSAAQSAALLGTPISQAVATKQAWKTPIGRRS